MSRRSLFCFLSVELSLVAYVRHREKSKKKKCMCSSRETPKEKFSLSGIAHRLRLISDTAAAAAAGEDSFTNI